MGIETLHGTAEAQDFHFFLGQIFAERKDVSVLVTSNESIGASSLVNVGESVHNLGPLDFQNTIKLFAYHCPHLHSARERKELLEEFSSHTDVNSPAVDELSGIIQSVLGGGIPAKTFAVAYEMTAEEVQVLHNAVKDQEREKNLDDGDDKGNDENAMTAGELKTARESEDKDKRSRSIITIC